MTSEQLQQLEYWFTDYVQSFRSEDPNIRENIRVKVEHTERVREAARQIGRSLHLSEGDLHLADACALFHDIGRFEQYTHHKTFVDAKSVDHAELGATILEKETVLDSLNPEERTILIWAVGHHNLLNLPEASPRVLFFTKLLRDADKIDIYKVVTDYYKMAHVRKNEAIQLDLPDTPEISPIVVEDIRAKRLVKKSHLTTLNDFKLLQMAWVYGFNYPETCRIVRERGYLPAIRKSLPQTALVDDIYQTLMTDLEERCESQIVYRMS